MNNDTDLCVKCGLCVPHCPTYRLTRNEADSPRGRIALIEGVASQRLAVTPKLLKHLDTCLQCRACERVCPSQVPFGAIIDQALETLNPQRPLQTRALSQLIKHDQLQSLGAWRRKLNWLPQWLLPKSWHRSAPVSQAVQSTGASLQPQNGPQVVLFQGCLTHDMDPLTVHSAQRVLAALGVRWVTSQQRCCGAMHGHEGQTQAAQRHAQSNVAALFQADRPMVFLATGCGAFLREYQQRFGAPFAAFSAQAVDICDYLADLSWPELTPTAAASVLVHTPCSANNILRRPDAAGRLLAKLPHLNITSLPYTYCCGGAGSYTLKHADFSDALIAQQMHLLQPPYPDYLATTNLGCALQFSYAFKYHGIQTQVVHPVTLAAAALARQ